MFTGLLSSVSPGVIPHLPWIAGAAARGREETVGFRWLGLVEVARLVKGAHGEGGGRALESHGRRRLPPARRARCGAASVQTVVADFVVPHAHG